MNMEGYSPEMRKLIEIVEETRPERLRRKYRKFSLKERKELVSKWHPDYRSDTKRRLRIGPCRGEIVYSEIADLLEAWPLIEPDSIDLSRIDYDVEILVVGGGGAGAAAALWAYYSGVKPEDILLVTKLRFGDANTVKARTGIQAADRAEDSPILHYLDTMGGGHFVNKPELVKALVSDAPLIIKWLEDLGFIFDKTPSGDMIEYAGGGACRRRLHCARDCTGLELMRVIKDEVINVGIPVLEYSPAIELLTDPETSAVSGAILLNLETEEYLVVCAKVTILATGGCGRLHAVGFPTTNHYGATADGIVLGYRVGAKLRDMDTLQFHPTGAAWPEAIRGELVPEKTRSLGGQLVNIKGEMFVYELEPRDVVASAIIRECAEGRGVITPTGAHGVWLDTPLIEELRGSGTIKKELPALYRMFIRQGIDITEDPILVFPTLHYQNGGIEIDSYGRALAPNGKPIPGLFVAGEVTGGVHGRNRLVGNSLADILVFGRRAGINAAKVAVSISSKPKLSLNHLKAYIEELKRIGIPRTKRAPILLPDYRGEKVLLRSVRVF